MTISIESHVYLILTCDECGHEWGIEDYDAETVTQAELHAKEHEKCPECEKAVQG